MRFAILLFGTTSFIGLLVVQLALPVCKVFLECVIVAVSGYTMLRVLLENAPLYCQCPRCGKTIYKTRFRNAGKWIRCLDDCHIPRLLVPKLSFPQVIYQNVQRLILKKPLEEIAIVCKARARD